MIIPFVYKKENRTYLNTKDGYVQNMYAEKSGDGYDLVKRPAFKNIKAVTTLVTVMRGAIWCEAGNLLYVCIGDALFSVTPDMATVTDIVRKTPTSVTWAAGTATFVFAAAHGFIAGQIVKVSGVTPTGYNGNRTVVAVSTTTVANDTFTATIADPGGAGSGANMRISPIITETGQVFFESANNGGAAVKILQVPKTDSTVSQLFQINAGTVTRVTDADYPTDCVGAGVTIDGYYFVLSQSTTGAKNQLHNSDLENPTSWNALNYTSAEMYPDDGITLSKFHNQIMVLKSFSVEFFYNAANPSASPLTRIDQQTIQIGCASASSVVNIDHDVMWLGKDQNGALGVYLLKQGLPQKVSSQYEDRIFASVEAIIEQNKLNAFYLSFEGHKFYIISINGSASGSNSGVVGFAVSGAAVVGNADSNATFSRTLVYDITENFWSEWTSNNGSNIQVSFFGANAITGPYNGQTQAFTNALIFDKDSGDIFEMHPPPIGSSSATQWQDSQQIQCKIVSKNIDFGTRKRKQLNRLEILSNRHTATSNFTIKWSDDDYKTWSSGRTVDLQNRSFIDRLGQFRFRAFEFTHESNVPLRLKSFELEVEMLPH